MLQRCVGWRQQLLGGPHLAAELPRLQARGELLATDNPGRLRIFQADCNAFYRCIGIQRQPGGAGFGDAGLHDQQVDAARQPQSDNLAWPHTGSDQA